MFFKRFFIDNAREIHKRIAEGLLNRITEGISVRIFKDISEYIAEEILSELRKIFLRNSLKNLKIICLRNVPGDSLLSLIYVPVNLIF